MADHRTSGSRKLVLIDIENLLHGSHESFSPSALHERATRIVEIAEARRPTDLLVVGCNPQFAFDVRTAFPRARLLTRPGPHGADLALLGDLDPSHAASRFTELCIVSGDHAFAETAHDARRAGLFVRVVAPHFGLSAALRLQADLAVLLPDPTPTARAA